MHTQLNFSQIKQALLRLLITDFESARSLAEEFGLWDCLYKYVVKPVHLELARKDPNTFISYIMVDPETGETVEQQDFHREWQEMISTCTNSLICAPRGHGKCVTGETLLLMADGSHRRCDSLTRGEIIYVMSWTPQDGYSPQRARMWRDSVQVCYEIKTKSGRTLTVSSEHPCWTKQGWIPAAELVLGNFLAVAILVGITWDEVVSVECVGEKQTFSIEVENTHVHITNDFITHNTIQVAGRIVWELGNNHNIRTKIVGSSDEKAKEILGLVADLIKNSDQVHEVFPTLVIDSDRGDTKESFFVNRTLALRDPSVQASGVLSSGAGGRADLAVFDDVVDMKNAVVNPALRETVIRTVKETWFGLVSATGRMVWIATPYHQLDATHDLKNTQAGIWTIWWKPAITYKPVYDEHNRMIMEDMLDPITNEPVLDPRSQKPLQKPKTTQEILWPSKWSLALLKLREIALGTRIFARQYLLNAMSDDERTFSEEEIKRSFDRSLIDIGDGIEDEWPTYGGVDLASALGKKAAWTVIWTLAKHPETGRLYLKSMWRGRKTFTEILDAIRSEYIRHKWQLCYVENNGFQQSVIDSFDKNDKSIPIKPYTTTAGGKFNETTGLPGLSVAISKGAFAIPAGRFNPEGGLPADDLGNLSVFMNELRAHPGGEFSDTIMSFWFAWKAATEGNDDFLEAYNMALFG